MLCSAFVEVGIFWGIEIRRSSDLLIRHSNRTSLALGRILLYFHRGETRILSCVFRYGFVVVASAGNDVRWELGAQLVRRRGLAGSIEAKTEVATQSNVLLQRTDRQPRERLVSHCLRTYEASFEFLATLNVSSTDDRLTK